MFDPMGARARPRRRGSTYLMVLGISLIVTVIGLSAITVSRIESRIMLGAGNEREADLLAAAAVEHALARINAAAEVAEESGVPWRTLWTSGEPVPDMPLGRGTINWYLVDETDGDLDDDPDDPLRLHGVGIVGDAVRSYTVMLVPKGRGLALLNSALLAGKDLHNDDTLTVTGGPAYVNGSLFNDGTINGRVDAVSVTTAGSITGMLVSPAPPQPLPPDGLFETYRDRGKEIDWEDLDGGSGDLTAALLSAGDNPYGKESDEGVYYIHVPPGGELDVQCKRIRATLVVRIDIGGRLRVGEPMLWEPHSPDAPILIVKGTLGVDVELDPDDGPIDESDLLVNLNPPHTPYLGSSDATLDDAYPHVWRGLIHVVDQLTDLKLGSDLQVQGTIVSAGSIEVESGSVSIVVDPNLFANPPIGYTGGSLVSPVASSWRREVVVAEE